MALFQFDFRKTPEERAREEEQRRAAALQPLLGLETFQQQGPTRPGEMLPQITAQQQGMGLPGLGLPQAQALQGLLSAGYTQPVAETLLKQTTSPEPSAFGGTGMDAQTYNTLISGAQKKASGQPMSAQESLAYNLAYQRAGRPQRFVTPSGQMIEQPGINLSQFPAPTGLESQKKELGIKPKSAETAGKMAMLDTARRGLEIIEPILFTRGGINTDAIKGMWAINNFEPAAAFVSPDAQKLAQAYEVGIQAITRTETGAAMQKSELANTKQRFMPKPWDGKEVIRQKWDAFNLFIRNAEKYLKPDQQKGAVVDFDAVMRDAAKNKPGTPWEKYKGAK